MSQHGTDDDAVFHLTAKGYKYLDDYDGGTRLLEYCQRLEIEIKTLRSVILGMRGVSTNAETHGNGESVRVQE